MKVLIFVVLCCIPLEVNATWWSGSCEPNLRAKDLYQYEGVKVEKVIELYIAEGAHCYWTGSKSYLLMIMGNALRKSPRSVEVDNALWGYERYEKPSP